MTVRGSRSLATVLLGLSVLPVALVGVSGPAFAADLGTLTVSPSSGSVGSGVDDVSPMFGSVLTSAGCPSGYGTNAVAKVGPVGGPYNNLNRIGGENNYDAGAFSLEANRSMARALGVVPGNGGYEIVVQCSGEILGDHPNYFRVPITVSAGTWTVSAAPPGPTGPPGGPAGTVSLRAEVAPGTASPTSPTATPSQPGDPGGGGDLPVTGLAIGAVAAAGLLLVTVGAALRAAARRRRAAFVGDEQAG